MKIIIDIKDTALLSRIDALGKEMDGIHNRYKDTIVKIDKEW